MTPDQLVPYFRHLAASKSLSGHTHNLKSVLAMAADHIEQLRNVEVDCDLKHDGYAMDHHARVIGEELRKWWRFSDTQQPQSSWHDREDFIAKKLPELMRAIP